MSGNAEATVLAALQAVVRDHGWLVTGNVARLRATLSDILGPQADEHRGLVDSIVVSAEEGVPAEVRAGGRARLEELAPALTARLVDWGMAEERARWAVDAWASLLPEPTLDPGAVPVVTAPPAGSSGIGRPAERRTDREPATDPTTLPPVVPHQAPTELPPTHHQVEPSTTAEGGAGRSRRALVIAVAAAVVVVLGGIAGAIALTRGDEDPGSRSSSGTTDDGDGELPRATGDEIVVSATGVTPIRPVPMGGWRAAVTLIGLSPVDTLVQDGKAYAPPEGGSLVGFQITSGGCEDKSLCELWWDSRVSVEVDGHPRPLPSTNRDLKATFVVAVPAATRTVDLVLQSDGRRQSISLLTGQPAAGNIAVLGRSKRFWSPDKKFSMTERVSINIDYGDGIGRRSETRRVEVQEYSLHFWANRKTTASAADRALLRVNTFFNYPQDDDPGETVWYWRSDEVQFRDASGRLYRPVRMPANKETNWYDFEYFFDVPANITSGTLLLGGSIDLEGGDGTPYTATTPVTPFPLRLS